MKTNKLLKNSKKVPQLGVLVLAICFAGMLASLKAHGQSEVATKNIRMQGVYIDPLAGFDGRKEILIGYQRAWSKLHFLDIGMGYRYQYPSDPMLLTYEIDTFKGTVTRNCYEEFTFWIVGTGGDCEGIDDPTLETDVDKYLRSDGFVKFGMKFFSDDANSKFGVAFVKVGLQIGLRSYREYRYTNGNIYRDKEIVSVQTQGNSFEGTRYYTYAMKSFAYEKLTKKTVNEFYILPEVGLGYRIMVADKFTIDLEGMVYFGDKFKNTGVKRGFHANGGIQLTYWL
ncbi:MAG: hypothetical protein K9J37_09080 [Saprospiraceae bacterium]|nr:hypothetical protein [Saprospiraceae bacterium]MCF8250055.1 hypothetical protein [Saprospiraceae bacterium]MCF8279517.1 hypothetical protein [Bacteroidales bacterium]MCF8311979.1 hypothetical protein [Saprospiraceae bacterium]MCF8440331.1 hypothetical protein [Saprospiraceae bacterium]